MKDVYIQFGGFTDCPDGWVNFEPSFHLRAQRLPIIGQIMGRFSPHRFNSAIRVGDVLKGLPVEDGTATAVFSSHVLEHLSRADAISATKEVFRILRPGGVFRCVVPDLQTRAQQYLEQYDELDEPAAWFLDSTLLGRRSRPRGQFKRVATALLSTTEHKWMWDFRSLSHVLIQCGFEATRRVEYGDAVDPMFKHVEKRERFFWSLPDSPDQTQCQEFNELAIEGVKPDRL